MNLILNVFTPENIKFLLKGLGLTLILSISIIIASIIFGTLLALGRNYGSKLIKKIASTYIEIFRNTPLLLWILAVCFMLPFGTVVFRGGLALTLYTSSVIAEIIRGGLNSIDLGQFEAAASQGFTFIQTLWYIVLPQTFNRIIPSLLSQVITTVKDTAFLQVVAIPEFTRSGFVVMGRYTKTSEVFLIFTFIALGYFVICFALSSFVRNYQKKINYSI